MVTFRNSTKCKHIPLPSWFTPDVPQMVKKLVVKELTFDKRERNAEKVCGLIGKQLTELNGKSRLNIIGGIQLTDHSFECLFFQEDKARPQ